MKKLLRWGLPFVALAVSAMIVFALFAFKPPVDKSDDNRQIAALNVAPASVDIVRVNVATQGEVRPRTEIDLIPEVSGRIVEMHPTFAEGGRFTPDTVLAKIDDAQYRLAYIRAEARVAEAKVQLEQELADARIKEKQWKDWVKEGDPTPLALNKPQVAQAQANLRAAEADLEEAQLNLQRTEIKLPFVGRVSTRTVGLGQYVTAGAALGRVFATDVVEVRLPLTDRQLGELELPVGYAADEAGAEPIAVTLSAEMAGRMRAWNGRIIRTQASIDNQTRLFYAIAEVTDPYGPRHDAPLPVGLFVSAQIESSASRQAIVIPRPALRGDNTVYVVEEDKLLIRTVDVLSTNSDTALIVSGLEDGDQVVTSPVRSAINGMEVRISSTAVADGESSENSTKAVGQAASAVGGAS